ncbi:MAG TPA: MarR family transcriptional regulator [Propionibacteriaceae bacterium]|nr:MarR family transcriptional regulator [Propionibacteriaceae bacterium]
MVTTPTSDRDRQDVAPADRDPVEWLSDEQQSIWRAWLLGVARIDDYLDADLRTRGLDMGEYEILVVLSEAENRSMRMSELADLVHQSRSRLTHTIARMERTGFVVRTAAEDDRRGVIAWLTDDGFALLQGAAPSHVEAVRRIFVDAVRPADFEAIGRAMEAVLAVRD